MKMLYESKVIDYVRKYLKQKGYSFIKNANENQTGDDLIMKDCKNRLIIIEAKGETSSKEGTKRFGEPFTKSQCKTHISIALLRALIKIEEKKCNFGIALPKNKINEEIINKIQNNLKKLSISIFWVNNNGNVKEINNWK